MNIKYPQMIVSSLVLRECLNVAIPADRDDIHELEFKFDGHMVRLNGQPLAQECRNWTDYTIDRGKAMKLHRLLMAMSEQPITVGYDGNWFIIQEILI